MSRTDKRYHVIINEAAGSGQKKRIWQEKLKPELLRRGVHFRAYECVRVGDSAKAMELIQQEKDTELTIIVIGGDGTFNEVINHVYDFSRVTFGFIPMGSANDLGFALGIPADPVQALIHMLRGDQVRSVDLGRTAYQNGEQVRYFAISSGVGLDAETCRVSVESDLKAFLNRIHLGRLIYQINAVKMLFTQPLTGGRLVFYDSKGNEIRREVHRLYFLAGMNQPNEGGHLIMAPKARPNDGKLSFAVAENMSRLRALYSLALLALHRMDLIASGYEVINARGCRIELAAPLELHTDGETHGRHTQLVIECLPGRLQMLL